MDDYGIRFGHNRPGPIMSDDRTFVSYSRSDSEFAQKLANDLQANDIVVWLDRRDISGGARWDKTVEEALRDSARVLVLLSRKAVKSDNVSDEWSLALDEGKPVVPALVEPCDIPMRLRRRQYVDFTRTYDSALEQLVATLKGGNMSLRPEPAPRNYRNYLAPLIISHWLRNVLMNQLILIPALGAAIFGTYLFYFLQLFPIGRYVPTVPYYAMPLVAVTLIAMTLPIAIRNLSGIAIRQQSIPAKASLILSKHRDEWLVPVLIFMAGIVLGTGSTGARIEATLPSFPGGLGVLGAMFFVLFFVLQTFGGFRQRYRDTHRETALVSYWKDFHPIWMSAVCSALLVSLLHLLWTHDMSWHQWTRVTLGPPLVSGALMLTLSLLIGLMAADYPDEAREWLRRSGVQLSLATIGWLVLFGMTFFGPWAVALALGGPFGRTTVLIIVAWISVAAAGIFAYRKGRGNRLGWRNLDWLVGLAPPLIMMAYLLLAAFGAHQAFAAALDIPSPPLGVDINHSFPGFLEHQFAEAHAFAASYHDVFGGSVDVTARMWLSALLLLPCVLVASVVSARLNFKQTLASFASTSARSDER